MLRHVALFRWADGTAEEQKGAISDTLARPPSVIPELRDYRFGDALGLAGSTWDSAVAADFDDAAGWRTYRDHPAHQQAIGEHIRPVTADRAYGLYEL